MCATSAAAQGPRDRAANKKIDEAINQQYLATNFDKAEGILIGTINACDDKCSAPVLARAWMYLGIVRGSGKNDIPGAQEAFAQAVALDPAVKLDAELATSKTARAFEAAGGRTTRTPAGKEVTTGGPPPGPPPPAAGGGDLKCSPTARDLATRYPLPVSCAFEGEADKLQLYFAGSAGDWKRLTMSKRDGFHQAQVPCSATQSPGTLRVYVRARSAAGKTVAQWGSREAPIEFTVATESGEAPPAFPNQDAPERCAESEECPPDFPGCKDSGGGGDPGTGGCESDQDCGEGTCVSGTCEARAGTQPFKRNWLGLHVGQDWAFVGGSDVCSPASQADNGFACYYRSQEKLYGGVPQPNRANNIESGFVLATTRFLVSYDRAFSPQFTLGARGGYAIGGGPPAAQGTKFLPAHFEVRGTFFPLKNSLSKRGLRPSVHIGGGMAQVDAKMPVTLVDCSIIADTGAPSSEVEQAACAAGAPNEQHPTQELHAYKKLGQGFVTFGVGAVYALTGGFGVQLSLNGMFMLPTSGAVVEPSLGLVFGL
ncbi:MAG TPA: hypothetical protein VK524_01010 [Polyangiaceae bacterium]|nr:hypothetical protein [Polyangiaceae bacterium]